MSHSCPRSKNENKKRGHSLMTSPIFPDFLIPTFSISSLLSLLLLPGQAGLHWITWRPRETSWTIYFWLLGKLSEIFFGLLWGRFFGVFFDYCFWLYQVNFCDTFDTLQSFFDSSITSILLLLYSASICIPPPYTWWHCLWTTLLKGEKIRRP